MMIKELLEAVCDVETFSIGIEKENRPMLFEHTPIEVTIFLNSKLLCCDEIELFEISNDNLSIMLKENVDVKELKS